MYKWIIRLIIVILLGVFARGIYLLSPSTSLKRYQTYFQPDNTDSLQQNEVAVTFFGNTTLLFDDGQTQILIDPFVTRPDLWQVYAHKIQSDTHLVNRIIHTYKIKRLKGIFTSHSHYDHVFDVAQFARKTGATVYGTPSTLNVARGGNIENDQLQEYTPDNIVSIGKFTVTVLPSVHSKPTRYNNDLGEEISTSLRQPARYTDFKEGGSHDFYICHDQLKILIRASYNSIPNQLDSIRADLLFLGITGLGKAAKEEQDSFYAETIGKVKPQTVIPIHWDDFFVPIEKKTKAIFHLADNVDKGFNYLIKRTEADSISFMLMDKFQRFIIRPR